MGEENQTEFSGWARVEVMGHQQHIGYVTTQAFGQAVLFRVDSPEIPKREETLSIQRWTGLGRFPAGSVIRHEAIPATSVLLGAGSIYRIIPCTEQVAIESIVKSTPVPFALVSGPRQMLPSGADEMSDDDQEIEDESNENDQPYF